MNPQTFQYPTFLKDELRAVESLLLETHPDVKLHPNVPPHVMAAIRRLIQSGGKRLRPALAMLSAHLCGADIKPAISVAASIEMLHTATLIHDDLIDSARLRRNQPTLNTEWSAAATILTLPILLVFVFFFDIPIGLSILALPVVMLIQFVFTVGLAFMLSALCVHYRDIQHLLGNFLTLWFFATPIIYPLKQIPEKFQFTVHLNPIAPLIFAYQDIFFFLSVLCFHLYSIL